MIIKYMVIYQKSKEGKKMRIEGLDEIVKRFNLKYAYKK